MGSQYKHGSSDGKDGEPAVVYMESISALALDVDSTLSEDSESVLIQGKFQEARAPSAAPESRAPLLGKPPHCSFLRGKVRLFGHFVPIPSLLLVGFEGILFFGLSLLLLTHPAGMVASDFPEGSFLNASVISMVLLLNIAALGLYSAHQRADLGGVILRTLASFGCSILVLESLYWLIPTMAVDQTTLGAILLVCLAGYAIVRPLYYQYVDGTLLRRRILVLGTGERAQAIERLRRRSDNRGFHLAGFVKVDPKGRVLVHSEKVVPMQAFLCRYALQEGIDEIVIALDDRRNSALPTDELLDCRMSGMDVTDILDFFERETGKIRLDLLQPGWLIHSDGFKHNLARDFAKRAFDIALGMALFLVASPFMLLTALAILIESRGRGSILYRQKRVGKGGRIFELIKFRSMREDAEKDGKARWAQEDDPRVTRVGRFIRKCRLDELPQLWNVLRNDMSIVGPRPERPEFVSRLSRLDPLYNERHRVKPGITGWAQVRYAYGASDKDAIEKLQYDLYYVKNHRLVFDLYILIQTVEVVLFNIGAR